MAKKSRASGSASRPQQKRAQPTPSVPRWRQKLVLGGVVLVLVIGIGVFVRLRMQRDLTPRLQGAVDNHYTRGVAGAPVVIKEFSDYT
jgi:hypothetical protein